MKMRLHYFILVMLIDTFPKLFNRYFEEYQEVKEMYNDKYYKQNQAIIQKLCNKKVKKI
jgi:hypothetical protein